MKGGERARPGARSSHLVEIDFEAQMYIIANAGKSGPLTLEFGMCFFSCTTLLLCYTLVIWGLAFVIEIKFPRLVTD